MCVTARKDGKKVVTEQWVDDSIEFGVRADADRVSLPMHSPLSALRFTSSTTKSYALYVSMTHTAKIDCRYCTRRSEISAVYQGLNRF